MPKDHRRIAESVFKLKMKVGDNNVGVRKRSKGYPIRIKIEGVLSDALFLIKRVG